MPEILIGKTLALESLMRAPLSPASRMIAELAIDSVPVADAEHVRHGRWIECDYKHLEHGFMQTDPNAGLCCSECRTAFQKKKMTYKQYCAACGAKMNGGADDD